MKPHQDSADRGAGSGCMARLVRFSSLICRAKKVAELVHNNLSGDKTVLERRSNSVAINVNQILVGKPRCLNLLPFFFVLSFNATCDAFQSSDTVKMEVGQSLVDIVGEARNVSDLGSHSLKKTIKAFHLASLGDGQQGQPPSNENPEKPHQRSDESNNLVVSQSKTNWHLALELLLLGFAGILVGCAICVAGWQLSIVRANAGALAQPRETSTEENDV